MAAPWSTHGSRNCNTYTCSCLCYEIQIFTHIRKSNPWFLHGVFFKGEASMFLVKIENLKHGFSRRLSWISNISKNVNLSSDQLAQFSINFLRWVTEQNTMLTELAVEEVRNWFVDAPQCARVWVVFYDWTPPSDIGWMIGENDIALKLTIFYWY